MPFDRKCRKIAEWFIAEQLILLTERFLTVLLNAFLFILTEQLILLTERFLTVLLNAFLFILTEQLILFAKLFNGKMLIFIWQYYLGGVRLYVKLM